MLGSLENGGLADRREEARHPRVFDAPGEMHPHDSLHGSLRIVVATELLEERALVTGGAVRVDGAGERLLAFEVVEEAAIARAGLALDLLQRRRRHSLIQESRQSGVNDRLSPSLPALGRQFLSI